MSKQKAGFITVMVLFFLGAVYISSGKLENLTSNMLANGGCSQSFLTKNKDSYTQDKKRFNAVQRQISEIQSTIVTLQERINAENKKINAYNQEIQNIQKKISKANNAKVIKNLRDDIQRRQNSIKGSQIKIRGYIASIGKYKTDVTNLKNSILAEQKTVTTYEKCEKNLSRWPNITTDIMPEEIYTPRLQEETLLGETMMPDENGIILGNIEIKSGEMNLYRLLVKASQQKDVTVNSFKFATTVTKTGESVDGKIYDSWFLRSQSDNAICTCTNSSEEYGKYIVECPMNGCSKKIKKNNIEVYTLFSKNWATGKAGSMTTRFIDMSYDDDKGGVNNMSVPKKLSFSVPTTGTEPEVDICTSIPELCGGNSWAVGAWSSCQNNTQSRTVECQNNSGNTVNNSDCSNPQPVSSQSCTQPSMGDLANFVVTAPTEVYTNEAFNISVKAIKSDNTKLSSHVGTVYFDLINRSPEDIILPSFGDNGYKFTTADQGEHTFSKAFTVKKPGTYIIDTYEIESNANNGNGVSTQVTIVAKDKTVSTTPIFTGFNLSLPATASINTPVNLSITAMRSDNSTDISYNKSVVILIDGDSQATLPLTAQTLSEGTLSLPGSLTFESAGTKTVIVKDVETGTEARKTITVIADEEDNENVDNSASSPIYTALLDNTTGLTYGNEINFMKLDIAANNKSDILIKTIPLNIRIYTKRIIIGNLKLRDREGKIINVSMTTLNKVNEFDKDIQLEIKFNTPYAVSAGTGTSFTLTGVVTGESDEYDTIVTWLGDKGKFTGTNVTLQKPFTGEDISGYSWNAISLMRRR